MNRFALIVPVVGAMLGLSTAANAVILTDLYNTGLGVGGATLAAGNGQTDANYTVTPGTIGTAGQAVTYFNPAYSSETPESRWISYQADGGSAAGTFTLSTTFNLTGYQVATASVSGLWGVDNVGEIFLNGVTTGITNSQFSQLTAFSINTGFIAGINTLSFRIIDQGPPAALRVDGLTGSAELAAPGVPEPATWGLMIAGFVMTGAAMRRRSGSRTVSA